MSNGAGDAEAEATEAARDRLREFQVKMYALEDLLQDQDQTEFCVVTLPTELAMAESERLVAALGTEGIGRAAGRRDAANRWRPWLFSADSTSLRSKILRR